jgi:hypothetical protein
MTPAEFIRVTRAALRTDNAREILAHITRPEITWTTISAQRNKPEARLAWEQAVTADLSAMFEACTGNGENAVSRTRQLGTTAAMINAAAAAKIQRPEHAEAIGRMADRCLAHYVQFLAEGGVGMIPAHFGQATYVEPESTPAEGPSQWAALFPDQPAPSMDEVAAMMEAE